MPRYKRIVLARDDGKPFEVQPSYAPQMVNQWSVVYDSTVIDEHNVLRFLMDAVNEPEVLIRDGQLYYFEKSYSTKPGILTRDNKPMVATAYIELPRELEAGFVLTVGLEEIETFTRKTAPSAPYLRTTQLDYADSDERFTKDEYNKGVRRYAKHLDRKGLLRTSTGSYIIDPGFLFTDATHHNADMHAKIMDAIIKQHEGEPKISKYRRYEVSIDGFAEPVRVVMSHSLLRTRRVKKTPGADLDAEKAFTYRVLGHTLGKGAYGKAVENFVKYTKTGDNYTQQATKRAKVIKVQKRRTTGGIYSTLNNWTSKLLKELSITAKVHDHTRPVVLWNNVGYMMMERFPGDEPDRVNILDREFNDADYVYLLSSLTRGLLDLSERHVLHSDVKPANMIMSEKGVKFIDFGLSKEMTTRGTTDQPGGSPRYTAPEVFYREAMAKKSDGTPSGYFDERLDVFSAGMTFLDLLLDPTTMKVFRPLKKGGGFIRPSRNWNVDAKYLESEVSEYFTDKDIAKGVSRILTSMLQAKADDRIMPEALATDVEKLVQLVSQKREKAILRENPKGFIANVIYYLRAIFTGTTKKSEAWYSPTYFNDEVFTATDFFEPRDEDAVPAGFQSTLDDVDLNALESSDMAPSASDADESSVDEEVKEWKENLEHADIKHVAEDLHHIDEILEKRKPITKEDKEDEGEGEHKGEQEDESDSEGEDEGGGSFHP